MLITLKERNKTLTIGFAWQRNMNSLDSYSSTSTGQQRDRSLKLSRYIDSCEGRNKPVLESQIPTSRTVPQQDENGGKNLFTGAVFTTASSPLLLLMLATLSTMPQFQWRNWRESCPPWIAPMNYEQTFVISLDQNWISTIRWQYFLDFDTFLK